MHYYQHHIGDFIKDTSFLTNEEVGIYVKLLWLYYDTEKPLPNDIFTLSMKTNTRDCVETIQGILNMFFVLVDNEWRHIRCDEEIAIYHRQLEVASRAGKASAAKRKSNGISTPVERSLDLCATIVQPTNNHKPITNKTKTLSTKVDCPVGVSEQVWNDWLAIRKAKKMPLTPTAMEAMKREAEKLKMSLADVIQICCERTWAGFKASYLENDLKVAQAAQPKRWWDSVQATKDKAVEVGLEWRQGETFGQLVERIKSHIGE